MNGSHDWLDAVPAVLEAARLGSARAAAAELGLGTATITRHIDRLEQHLGVLLFHRSRAGLSPTPALVRLRPSLTGILDSARGVLREAAGLDAEVAGTVRLAILPAVASLFVAPELPDLLARHPDLHLELVADNAILDLTRGEADLALRAVRPTEGDLVTTALIEAPNSVVAAPSLLTARAPRTLVDLPWIAFDEGLRYPMNRWLHAAVPDAEIVLRATQLETLISAAKAGVGAMLLGDAMAARAGGLVRVPLPTPPAPAGRLWLAAHQGLRDTPRIDAVWTWLRDLFTDADALATLRLMDGTIP